MYVYIYIYLYTIYMYIYIYIYMSIDMHEVYHSDVVPKSRPPGHGGHSPQQQEEPIALLIQQRQLLEAQAALG